MTALETSPDGKLEDAIREPRCPRQERARRRRKKPEFIPN